MTARLYPDMQQDVIDLMLTSDEALVQPRPDWPKFNIMRGAYETVQVAAENLDKSISACEIPATALSLVHMIQSLLMVSATMGIDLRPIWTAAHRSRMNDTPLINIADLLDMQPPLVPLQITKDEDIPSGIPQEEPKTDG
jgi:hypothetical protein